MGFNLSTWVYFALMGLAFVVTLLVYPYVLSLARRHHIMDNPNARKLQRVPVPVMGGATVFIGLLASVTLGFFLCGDMWLVKILALLSVMFLIGTWDDVRGVPVTLRLFVEILVVWALILLLGANIHSFHGLWGIGELPSAVSVPLSLFAGVGIINAINLIDGVDGYCSTYGMMACASFAVIFYLSGIMVLFMLALIAIGALIPFFFHNVFGKTSKMFLGDGGSLMLGTLLTIFTFVALSHPAVGALFDGAGVSLVALTLAILAIPVFDTLKVMLFRMVRGQSLFHPDKTHLHHLFIEMAFSHISTSGILVSTNVAIIALTLLGWYAGVPVDGQVYIAIGLALLVTWGFYFFMEGQHRQNDGAGSALFQRWAEPGSLTSLSEARWWLWVRRMVDGRFLGGTPAPEEKGAESDVPAPENRPDPRIR